MIAPYFRLDHFERELPPGGPEHWTLALLDQAREAIAREIDDRLIHQQVAKQMLLPPDRLPPSPQPAAVSSLLYWQALNTREPLRHYRHDMPAGTAACYCALARRLIGSGDWETAGLALERVLCREPLSGEAQACLGVLAKAGGTAVATRLRQQYHFVFVGRFGQDRLKLPVCALPLPERREVAVTTRRAPGVYFFSLNGRFKRVVYLKLRDPLGLEAAGDGTLWVCDRLNARLVRFHPLTGFIEARPMRTTGPDAVPLYPIQARALGDGRFACVVSPVSQKAFFAGILSADGFSRFTSSQPLTLALARHDRQIFTRGFFDGSVERHDPQTGTADTAFEMPVLLSNNYAIARGKGGWFMDVSGRSIAKFSPEGKPVFMQSVDSLIDHDGLILHMSTCRSGKRELLYCANIGTNLTNGSILVFETAGPAPD